MTADTFLSGLGRAAHHTVFDEHPIGCRTGARAVAAAPAPVGAQNAALLRHGVELDRVVINFAVGERRGEIGGAFVARDDRIVLADHHAVAAGAAEGRRVQAPALVFLLRERGARIPDRQKCRHDAHARLRILQDWGVTLRPAASFRLYRNVSLFALEESACRAARIYATSTVGAPNGPRNLGSYRWAFSIWASFASAPSSDCPLARASCSSSA